MRTLRDQGPSKLTESEQRRVRDAADALLFSQSIVRDETARAAIADVGALARQLTETGRWSQPRMQGLVDDVEACGPAAELAWPVAA